jgi:hypothetical protein
LNGDYYDWIVSKEHPEAFALEVYCDYELPISPVELHNNLLIHKKFTDSSSSSSSISSKNYEVITDSEITEFTVSLSIHTSKGFNGTIVEIGDMIYELVETTTLKPNIRINETIYSSVNKLANSDSWRVQDRGTSGTWFSPILLQFFSLTIAYSNGVIKTYINGVLDECVEVEISGLTLGTVRIGDFEGWVDDAWVFGRAILQDEAKAIYETYEFLFLFFLFLFFFVFLFLLLFFYFYFFFVYL